MKLSTELLKSSIGLPVRHSYRLISRHELSLLITFYHSLGQEERKIRFGAAVNNESIISYCERIDWRSTIVIAREDSFRLIAVATNVRIDATRVENATIWAHKGIEALPTLLRLSAVAAADLFAADQLIVEFHGAPWIVDQLREIGRVCIADDHAWLKIGSALSALELSPKVGDGGNREGGISWGCLTPPLLHRRSDMPCPTITSSI